GDAPDPVGAPEHVGGVDRARWECFSRREMELRRGERTDKREALAEGAAGVEVRRQRHCCAGIDEPSRGRHWPVEKERARGQKYADDVTLGERPDPLFARRLQMVDGAGAELDCEWDRAGLRELVAV